MGRMTGAERTEFLEIKRLCYSGLEAVRLRSAVAERLATFARADAFVFLALDPASGLPVDALYAG